MDRNLSPEIDDNEFLYRGIIEKNWDYENNRPSSATFKDSRGASVDRDGWRSEYDCINFLNKKMTFFAICKVKTRKIRDLEAIVKYLPEDDNIFHSEIHDSEERVRLRGKKPKAIRDNSLLVYKQYNN